MERGLWFNVIVVRTVSSNVKNAYMLDSRTGLSTIPEATHRYTINATNMPYTAVSDGAG
ncbi:MAG: hypothetical protein LBV16_03015 [Elusimicrobiota bacterium]|jgi:hypothetical protein|nr:hypothetical protein [Elusimicrobiota bacterium]